MRSLTAVFLLLGLGMFSSCQCAEPPEVPPVEDTAAESAAASAFIGLS